MPVESLLTKDKHSIYKQNSHKIRVIIDNRFRGSLWSCFILCEDKCEVPSNPTKMPAAVFKFKQRGQQGMWSSQSKKRWRQAIAADPWNSDTIY